MNFLRNGQPGEELCASTFGCDGILAGYLTVASPAPDHWFAADGIDASTALDWTRNTVVNDTIFKEACENGSATGSAVQSGIFLESRRPPGETHILWVCVPDSIDGKKRWCAAFLRGGERFTPEERDRLVAQVRFWQAQFNHPDEEGLSYLLVGTDPARPLTMDPCCQLRLFDAGITPSDLLHELFVIYAQRWPTMNPGERHDAALPFGDRQLCAMIHYNTPVFEGAAPQRLIELRPLEPGELPPVGSIEDDRVARALGYLHDHFHEGPTLNELAAQVNISPFHFHRVFAKHVGVSPKQYQLLKQLQVSKWRLRCGGEPIGEIAEHVGFANHAHFTATFRRVLGISPTEFRATARAFGA